MGLSNLLIYIVLLSIKHLRELSAFQDGTRQRLFLLYLLCSHTYMRLNIYTLRTELYVRLNFYPPSRTGRATLAHGRAHEEGRKGLPIRGFPYPRHLA